MTNEEYVRSVWEDVTVGRDIYGYGITLNSTRRPHSFVGYEKKRDACQAAAEFTRKWLEQIADVEAEIEWLGKTPVEWTIGLAPNSIPGRILAREKEVLENLRCGMKEKANG